MERSLEHDNTTYYCSLIIARYMYYGQNVAITSEVFYIIYNQKESTLNSLL